MQQEVVSLRAFISSGDFSPQLHSLGRIHIENLDGRPAFWSQADDYRSSKGKMFPPYMQPWIEQSNEIASLGIETSDVGAFERIASVTSQCQVGILVASAVLFRNYVLDDKRRVVNKYLLKTAVFATVFRTLTNEFPCSSVHCGINSRDWTIVPS